MKTKLILPIAFLFFSLAANAQSPTKQCIDNADTIKIAIGVLNPIYSLSKSELTIKNTSNASIKISKVKNNEWSVSPYTIGNYKIDLVENGHTRSIVLQSYRMEEKDLKARTKSE